MEKIYLMLEDGKYFVGKSFGSKGTFTGEVVFNTAMTGYQEIITDPSYYGQMVLLTYSLIGNYGVNIDDNESKKSYISALIVKEYHDIPSNWRSEKSLKTLLTENNIPAIEGIDTRALVRHLRDQGAMRAVISTEISDKDELMKKIKESPKMEGLNLADKVSTKTVQEFKAKKEEKVVHALDFGIKKSIVNEFNSRGISIKLYPSNTSAEELLEGNPDGIFLSNGPGDPAAVVEGIKTVKKLVESDKPIFGICLGHQILSNAIGAETYKLKFGHHAGNHPVKNLKTNKIEISSQNHGFAVKEESLPTNVEITHVNLNDKTIEGIADKNGKWFTIQYHPEAGPGPHDAKYLFEQFKSML